MGEKKKRKPRFIGRNGCRTRQDTFLPLFPPSPVTDPSMTMKRRPLFAVLAIMIMCGTKSKDSKTKNKNKTL
jgi:hypothetical protein